MNFVLVQHGSQIIGRVTKSPNIRRINDDNECFGSGKVGPPLGMKLVSSAVVLGIQIRLIFNQSNVTMARPYQYDQFSAHIRHRLNVKADSRDCVDNLPCLAVDS